MRKYDFFDIDSVYKPNFRAFIILSYFLNNEYFAVKLYEEYKIKELEIRNNLKLGVPSLNEFHIEKEVSIFFKNQKNNEFYEYWNNNRNL